MPAGIVQLDAMSLLSAGIAGFTNISDSTSLVEPHVDSRAVKRAAGTTDDLCCTQRTNASAAVKAEASSVCCDSGATDVIGADYFTFALSTC